MLEPGSVRFAAAGERTLTPRLSRGHQVLGGLSGAEIAITAAATAQTTRRQLSLRLR